MNTDPKYWEQAKKTPSAPTAPGPDSQVRRLHALWTLTKGGADRHENRVRRRVAADDA